jgi:hypothetical protein
MLEWPRSCGTNARHIALWGVDGTVRCARRYFDAEGGKIVGLIDLAADIQVRWHGFRVNRVAVERLAAIYRCGLHRQPLLIRPVSQGVSPNAAETYSAAAAADGPQWDFEIVSAEQTYLCVRVLTPSHTGRGGTGFCTHRARTCPGSLSLRRLLLLLLLLPVCCVNSMRCDDEEAREGWLGAIQQAIESASAAPEEEPAVEEGVPPGDAAAEPEVAAAAATAEPPQAGKGEGEGERAAVEPGTDVGDAVAI